ncbi:NRDE family protein [Marinobacter orientalis]|uniref:NRDE family protein n=1 Tax=Marinobacter orientalis TaxID=1928859 RepID=A0A7Y0RD42_9GAMM|nr:NRDE family protein [Marinobacter orientalis]NMT64027.1 NRDE family protein [Marinobacter orientalis]TGX49263.1 NRDE family protein [Marinobacter orientalis]
MCLIVFSLRQHPDFPLVVAANRDEFFQRPTAAMDWWTSETAGREVLAGRDLLSGGTWLAVDIKGRVSAVTNVREASPVPGPKSRGELPLLALADETGTPESLIREQKNQYSGFNLVSLNTQHGWYFSNHDAHAGRHVHRGTYGLSNHLLQTPWPKLLRLRNSVTGLLASARPGTTAELHQNLIERLYDTTPAPDRELPDTGVGLDRERFLSSPFIIGKDYGTRATTVVTASASGEIRVTEQEWGPEGKKQDTRAFCWQQPA